MLAVEPELFEILVIRELRKVGFVIGRPPRARHESLAAEAGGAAGYALEMRVSLGTGPEGSPADSGPDGVSALVVARHDARPLDEAAVRAVVARARELEARGAIVFSTAGFEPAAIRAAAGEPVVLLRVVDGRTAYDAGGWGAPGHYPAWLPEHVAQLVTSPGPGLEPRYEMTAAGQADRILERISGA